MMPIMTAVQSTPTATHDIVILFAALIRLFVSEPPLDDKLELIIAPESLKIHINWVLHQYSSKSTFLFIFRLVRSRSYQNISTDGAMWAFPMETEWLPLKMENPTEKRWKISTSILPYVTIYATLSHLYDDGHLLMIVSFSTIADWSIRHRINVKVSRWLLRTVLHLRIKEILRQHDIWWSCKLTIIWDNGDCWSYLN